MSRDLSNELFAEIAQYVLDGVDLLNMACVCKSFLEGVTPRLYSCMICRTEERLFLATRRWTMLDSPALSVRVLVLGEPLRGDAVAAFTFLVRGHTAAEFGIHWRRFSRTILRMRMLSKLVLHRLQLPAAVFGIMASLEYLRCLEIAQCVLELPVGAVQSEPGLSISSLLLLDNAWDQRWMHNCTFDLVLVSLCSSLRSLQVGFNGRASFAVMAEPFNIHVAPSLEQVEIISHPHSWEPLLGGHEDLMASYIRLLEKVSCCREVCLRGSYLRIDERDVPSSLFPAVTQFHGQLSVLPVIRFSLPGLVELTISDYALPDFTGIERFFYTFPVLSVLRLCFRRWHLSFLEGVSRRFPSLQRLEYYFHSGMVSKVSIAMNVLGLVCFKHCLI